MSTFDPLRSWQGSPRDAVATISDLITALGVPVEPPTERALRDWRTEELLTKTGRKLTARNLLEAIRIKQLRDQGLPVALIKDQVRGLTEEQLVEAIQRPDAPKRSTSSTQPEAERAVALLARGILQQFRNVQQGGIVGVTGRVGGLREGIPLALRQAQAHLARMYFENGLDDQVASVHELLFRCKQPLRVWAPPPIATHEEYADAILIDTDYVVPSEDCEMIAEQGGHLEDLIERQFHKELMVALEKLPDDERAPAYTLVRSFIAEHPLATHDEWRGIRTDPHLTQETARFLEMIYEPAHADLAVDGAVPRCIRCHGYIRRDGSCILASCRHVQKKAGVGERIRVADAFVARSAILKFWCDPAQEELRLFRELHRSYGSIVSLYPNVDRCDVSIGNEIGIDVKDYRDPIRLARRINRDLGGLRLYSRRILAIANRRTVDESYMVRFKEQLVSSTRDVLEIMTVQDAIDSLTKRARNHG
ncbi:MAG TPA: hypothetical protein PK156_25875 [Polyangium sp.]|nr:hypothetical protein [Polyangium sp.]